MQSRCNPSACRCRRGVGLQSSAACHCSRLVASLAAHLARLIRRRRTRKQPTGVIHVRRLRESRDGTRDSADAASESDSPVQPLRVIGRPQAGDTDNLSGHRDGLDSVSTLPLTDERQSARVRTLHPGFPRLSKGLHPGCQGTSPKLSKKLRRRSTALASGAGPHLSDSLHNIHCRTTRYQL